MTEMVSVPRSYLEVVAQTLEQSNSALRIFEIMAMDGGLEGVVSDDRIRRVVPAAQLIRHANRDTHQLLNPRPAMSEPEGEDFDEGWG